MVSSRLLLAAAVSVCSVAAARIGSRCTATTTSGPEPTGEPTGTKFFINFGDSYSQTGFDINGQKPSEANPMGNPPAPGWTASGGFNWVGFMATEFNAGDVRTFNLAYGGATTDADLVAPYSPEVLSFGDQVDIFLENIATDPKPEWASWTADNTIVGVWIGVNDVGNSFWLPNYPELVGQIMERYFEILQSVYDAGVREFALLSVPPTDRSPMFISQGTGTTDMVAAGIALYNSALESAAEAFEAANAGSQVFLVDTATPFNEALDNPTEYGSPDATCWNGDGVSCLWFNDYHPGVEINRLVGAEVARVVGAPFFGL